MTAINFMSSMDNDEEFNFDCVHLLYYKCHKINFKCDGSYINFTESIKNKKQQ